MVPKNGDRQFTTSSNSRGLTTTRGVPGKTREAGGQRLAVLWSVMIPDSLECSRHKLQI
jgi:hypothetical protein